MPTFPTVTTCVATIAPDPVSTKLGAADDEGVESCPSTTCAHAARKTESAIDFILASIGISDPQALTSVIAMGIDIESLADRRLGEA